MKDKTDAYNPETESIEILDRAMEHIKSVPYHVSLRWLFYRMYQDGLYPDKVKGYKCFKKITTKARRAFWNGWAPNTLEDDTRFPIYRGLGFWDRAGIGREPSIDTELTHFPEQEFYVEIWFEARAMISQMEYYTAGIPLRAFGGDPSLDYKWKMAKDIEGMAKHFEKPVTILYFGDCDKKGKQIAKTAERDARLWTDIDFDFELCGLTDEQANKYQLTQNWDKEGKPKGFQWEALSDDQARGIIMPQVDRYIDRTIVAEKEAESKEINEELVAMVTDHIENGGG